MNERSRPGRRLRNISPIDDSTEDSQVIGFAVRALEAIEDGDREFATELLEDAIAPPKQRSARKQRFECMFCSRRFTWPGERDDHEAIAHGVYREDVSAKLERTG
jgi:hypothetical protein